MDFPLRQAIRRRRLIRQDFQQFAMIMLFCQHRLVTEKLGLEKISLVVGFSMGAQQAFQWGALYPNMVENIAPLCGSARTSAHNKLFLESCKLCAVLGF